MGKGETDAYEQLGSSFTIKVLKVNCCKRVCMSKRLTFLYLCYLCLAHLSFAQGELLWSPFVRRPSCVNFFSSVTSGSIGMKLHRKDTLNDLTRFPSNFWDPCRILVSMATKWKKLQNSSSPKLVGRFSNNLVEMFLGWPSIRFLQAMLIGRKPWPPGGQGYFALYGYSDKFKNLLLRKCQADFQIIL